MDAVEGFGEDFGGAGFAGAARAGEQVGMGYLAGGDGIFQGRVDMFLADQVVEVLRPPLAIECYIRHEPTPP